MKTQEKKKYKKTSLSMLFYYDPLPLKTQADFFGK